MPLMTLELYCLIGYPFAEGQLVEHGDLLSELKRVQEGLLGGFERELITPNTLLITASSTPSFVALSPNCAFMLLDH
jgi:hypothetical protein